MTNFFESLLTAFQQRLTNPLMGSFSIFWGIYNWKVVYYLFASHEKVNTKILELGLMYNKTSWVNVEFTSPAVLNTAIPAVLAIASLILMPRILLAIQAMQLTPNRARIRQKVHMDFVRQNAVLQEELRLEAQRLEIESKTINRLKEEEKKLSFAHKVQDIRDTNSKTKGKKTITKLTKPAIKTNSKNIKPKPVKTPSSKKPSSTSYTLNNDLNLYPDKRKVGLKDFMSNYNTKSNYSRYLLILHYLKEIKNIEKVGVNDFYTCFKFLGYKVPNIYQGIKDASRYKGWLNTSSTENVQITTAGENAITHDLLITDSE